MHRYPERPVGHRRWPGDRPDLPPAAWTCPHFAAFPLVETADGRALLDRYFADYATIAARAGAA